MTARVDWRRRALAAEERVVALEDQLLTARGRPGRPRKSPQSKDTALVARACADLGVTRGELAERIGIGKRNAAMLSRATLPAAQREGIRALLVQPA